jgi:YidC/Oxa1 family membrane protein insertase
VDFSLITYHFILPLLEYFKKVLGSYGWSIIAVTLVVKVILYPLTKQQTESMKKMQALQPKIKLLQERFNQNKERYKDRPAKLKETQADFQKDMMEFYQKNQVNPLGGCFPMLFQLPILIALFWAFNGSPFKPVAVTTPIQVLDANESLKEQIKGSSNPTIYVGEQGLKGRLVLNPGEVRIPSGKEITYKVQKLEGNLNGVTDNVKWEVTDTPYYNPTYKTTKSLDSIASFQVNTDNTATIKAKSPGRIFLNAVLPAVSESEDFLFIRGLGKTGAYDPKTGKLNIDVIILVFLFTVTIWLSGKVTSRYSPTPADEKQAEMQKMMQTMMPPMVGVMTLFFPVPSGVLLYFVASGFIQIVQTWMVMRKPVVLEKENPKTKESEKKISSKV